MANQPVHLSLYIDAGPEADKEEQARLAQRLRKDLMELDVEAVEPVRGGSAPPGAKGDPVTLAAMAVTLAPIVLTQLMKALQIWLSRHERAIVTVEIGGEKIVVTGTPSEEQKRFIEAVVNRYGP